MRRRTNAPLDVPVSNAWWLLVAGSFVLQVFFVNIAWTLATTTGLNDILHRTVDIPKTNFVFWIFIIILGQLIFVPLSTGISAVVMALRPSDRLRTQLAAYIVTSWVGVVLLVLCLVWVHYGYSAPFTAALSPTSLLLP